MKVAVTARGKGPEVQVDPRFSRCNYFVIVNIQTEECEFLPNPRLFFHKRAGRDVAQELADREVICVVTGRIGPHAREALEAAGIEVYCAEAGQTVRDALLLYREGRLKASAPAGAIS
jgi:predicted Fe-Mo cluster-binding NifX family protein